MQDVPRKYVPRTFLRRPKGRSLSLASGHFRRYMGNHNMNINVEIILTQRPTTHEEHQVYEVAEYLTDNPDSVEVTIVSNKSQSIIAEFTIPNARQIEVVDRIGRAFWNIEHYSTSNISFPKRRARQLPQRQRHHKPVYTQKQGQYQAFIYYYTKIHRMAPAEMDFQQYFDVTPPTVHQMIVQLDERGFITRTPRQPRSIQLLLSREEIPDLE